MTEGGSGEEGRTEIGKMTQQKKWKRWERNRQKEDIGKRSKKRKEK